MAKSLFLSLLKQHQWRLPSQIYTQSRVSSPWRITSPEKHTSPGKFLTFLPLFRSLFEVFKESFWFRRDQLSVDDVKVYAAVSEKPSDAFPNASKWYDCVASQLAKRFVLSKTLDRFVKIWIVIWLSVTYKFRICCSFPGKAVGVSIGGSAAQPEVPLPESLILYLLCY